MNQAEQIICDVCKKILPILNEHERRLLAGCLAQSYGHGGQVLVCKYSKLSQVTVSKGIKELNDADVSGPVPEGRIRREGGGRKSAAEKNPEIVDAIDELLQKTTYGDPTRVILYTTLSLRKIAEYVSAKCKVAISRNIVSRIIEKLGYSKQQNQKMEQLGEQHPDRDAQFRHINETGKGYIEMGAPFISVDCKKKENIGNFKNNGQEYRHTGDPREVLDHDFPLKELGKVAPYGVYVVNNNTGFVNLGTSHDTAEFAVQSVRSWWYDIGVHTFPAAKSIYITCDGGGSNGSRNRLWKLGLAALAEETGLSIEVSHFPPGTSKWNKIEHRLFCYITSNWGGQPLVDIETVVNLINNTTTTKGLEVRCKLDERSYPTGTKVSDDEMKSIDIEYLAPNTGWNYVIRGFKNQ